MQPPKFQPIVTFEALTEIAGTRVNEAYALLEAGFFAGAVYLGGYAAECYLKAAICRRLDWDGLHTKLKTHDLFELLHFTGLRRQPEFDKGRVYASFLRVVETWNLYSDDSVRYRAPSDIDEPTARS
jgi:HEPN domain-containing protein